MRLTSKGQVTIPRKYREKFGIHPQVEVTFSEVNGYLVIQPAISTKAKMERWIKKARGSADTQLSTKQILDLTRK